MQKPCDSLKEDGFLARIKKEMTSWGSFEISRRFAAHHAESLAANRWSLRHSDHEEVKTKVLTEPPDKDTYNGIENFSKAIEKFWNGYN